MTPLKKDLMIVCENENTYKVYIRETYLLFLKRWIPLTYQETENSEEHDIEYTTFKEAQEFIDKLTMFTTILNK